MFFYDKPYLDNQFSLKADASTTVTNDYLTTNYTNTVALTSGYYNETETDNRLLSYSTGSYVDANFYNKTDTGNLLAGLVTTDYLTLKYTDSVDLSLNYYNKTENDNLLANKVSTTGDATISGTLNAQRLYITNTTSRPIEINSTMHDGPYLVAISQNYSNNVLSFALRCLPLNELWCFGVTTNNQYIISHENSTKLSIQSNGNTTITGNSDVGPSQAQTSINTYFNHVGSTGYMMMEGRYRDQGFLHFETNYQHGEMFLTVRHTFFIRCSDYAGSPYVQTFQPLTQSSVDRLKENEIIITSACETLSKLTFIVVLPFD